MDQETQKRFDTLRTTDPNAWSAGDREFMTARRDYLSEDEKKDFRIGESEMIDDMIPQANMDKNPGLPAQLPANPKPLEEMTKTELSAIAEPLGIEVGAFESKTSIIAKIETATTQNPQ